MLGKFISAKQYAGLVAQGHENVSPMLQFDPQLITHCYNRQPFLLMHRLAADPHFTLAPLLAMCRRMPADHVLFRAGPIPGDADIESSYDRYRRGLTLDEVLEHVEESRAYICVNNPELDLEFQPVIESLVAEVAAQIDPLDSRISWYSTYIFITSRDSVTPYHMDREMNFLLQIRGVKIVHLWDAWDHEILSSEQKDHLLAHMGERPPYKPSFESKAQVFELHPGQGLHHPFIAPHRVHTEAELSISLAVTFRTCRSDIWTDAHRFNARVRQLGLKPGEVGRNPLLDRAKCGVARAGQRVHRKLAGAERDIS
jgi:hypothetical protein